MEDGSKTVGVVCLALLDDRDISSWAEAVLWVWGVSSSERVCDARSYAVELVSTFALGGMLFVDRGESVV